MSPGSVQTKSPSPSLRRTPTTTPELRRHRAASPPSHLGRPWPGSHARLGVWPIPGFGSSAAGFAGRAGGPGSSGSGKRGFTRTGQGRRGGVERPAALRRYCAACHGENGDGNGPAARFLYPKPRNFREGQFRLVTTTNRVPSDEDLMRVLERGMPGSAMFPLGHLAEADRKALVAHVRRLIREGLEDRLPQGGERIR